MTIAALRQWLSSDEGISDEIAALRRWNARLCFGEGTIVAPASEQELKPRWPQLLLASSLLAESDIPSDQETALMIAQAAMVFGPAELVRDAGAVILSQLANRRAVTLATEQNLVLPGLHSRLGLTEQLLDTRRRLETAISVSERTEIDANDFQFRFWSKLADSDWTSATAPTAAGKTYLVLNWLLGEVEKGRCRLGIFLAPTRALVGEIEKQLLDLKASFDLPEFRVASLPMSQMGDLSSPTILVFTQERLHLFFNGCAIPPAVDVTVVDEAQKLNDGSRGVILQDAIERISRANDACRFVFLTPHAKNPEALVDDAPPSAVTALVPGQTPTVTQNLLLARQVYRRPKQWILSLVGDQSEVPVGEFELHDQPSGATSSKRLSYVALALGRSENATLIYANGAADAEKIAQQIYDGLAAVEDIKDAEIDEELADLSDFCRTAIHSRFQLVTLVKRGVAFHYGNMPTILRNEIERLFRLGKIRFLVCTSTLVEGVNLACRTIVMRGPKKGKKNHMSPQDFWNLAGRAGRWGADFNGNIVCVDPDQVSLWPNGVPEKTAYPIERETETVLRDIPKVSEYILGRIGDSATSVDERLEPVSAYLLAWQSRNGTILDAPSIKRVANPDNIASLENAITEATTGIVIPTGLIDAHPGVSALSMQALLNTFQQFDGPLEYLLPPYPGDENFVEALKEVFQTIDQTLAPVFRPETLQWAAAYTTRDWIRGRKLGFMISGAIERRRERDAGGEINYAAIIRNTMEFIEKYARFLSPKYLSAYLDVLRFHYEQEGKADEFPKDLPFDLYLEFGVNSSTLLAFIGLGLSRTSAIELHDFLARDDLDERQAFEFLQSEQWEGFDIPKLVKREVRELVARRTAAGLS